MDGEEKKKRYTELMESLNGVYRLARMAPTNADNHDGCRAAAEKIEAFMREMLLPVPQKEPVVDVEETQ